MPRTPSIMAEEDIRSRQLRHSLDYLAAKNSGGFMLFHLLASGATAFTWTLIDNSE